MENKYLYKFMPFNKNALMIILRHELYFASPDKLNDPIDCLHNIRIKNLSDLKEDDIIPMISKNRSFITWRVDLSDSEIAKHLVEDQLALLNLIIQIIRIKTYNKIGVCSFSNAYKDQRLWSHYADSSYGLCLVFDKELLTHKRAINIDKQDSQLRRFYGDNLNYDGQPFEIEIKKGDFQLNNDYFFKKTKVWDYEKEYRLVLVSDENMRGYSDYEKNRFCIFPKEALVEIILGEKMSSYDMYTISDLRKPLNYQYKVKKVTRSLETGEIGFMLIN
jgi:hypothetical protein